jgi:2-dehydro-3-deoxygluconokinase
VNDLVAVGETMALLSTPEIGRLRDMTSLRLSIAGAESNVAIGVARLGHRAAWIGRVGSDELGAGIVERLRREGVDVGAVVLDPEAQTAVMFKERRTAEVVRVTYYRHGFAGSRLCPADLDEEMIAGACILHVTGITLGLSTTGREAVYRAIEIAHDHGGLVSFDVNYRAALWSPDEAAAELAFVARQADFVFAGDDELALLGDSGAAADDSGPEREGALVTAALHLVGESARQVIIKRGAQGAICVDATGVLTEPALAVLAVDPVGAGDAFVAGYLAAVLDGADTSARLKQGCATGAFAVSVLGDWEGLPTPDDLGLLHHGHGTTLR